MTEPALDVAGWVERVRQQDEDAARLLLQHLYPLVLKLVRAHLPRRTDEEDLVQLVFMKVFSNLDQFSGTVPLEHWVSRIAINTCLNQISAEKVRPELRFADLPDPQQQVVESLAAESSDLLPGQALAASEMVDLLLSHLEPRDRLLIKLLYLEGRTPREVERLTGWNGVVIRVRAFRARAKMKSNLEQLMKENAL